MAFLFSLKDLHIYFDSLNNPISSIVSYNSGTPGGVSLCDAHIVMVPMTR
jgi:ATP adenylyltransferase/5',5'''-P-1,P-4-tetraphosphate phosphorylase II